MAIARMRKVTILAYEELEAPLFEKLRDAGLMHVTKSTVAGTEEQPEEIHTHAETPEYVKRLSQLAVIKSYFERYNTIKKSFFDMFTGKKPDVSYSRFKNAVDTYDIPGVFDKVKEHDEMLSRITERIADLEQKLQMLEPWRSLDIPLGEVRETRTCDTCLAMVPSVALASDALASPGVHHKVIWQDKGQAGIWLAVFAGETPEGQAANSLLAALGGTRLNLAREVEDYLEAGLVGDICRAIEGRLSELQEKRDTILAKDAEMAQGLLDILALTDYYLDKQNLDRIRKEAGRTRFTLIVEGYVKAKDMDLFRGQLSGFADIEIIDEEPGEDEDVPVYLENHPIIRPFEAVTAIYGYPNYRELDPTPWLAPFFWLFFGLCLGDAIYGIMLSLFSWWFIKTQNLEDERFMRLLMYCGFSTILAGALTGSWFGDFPVQFLKGTVIERITSSMAVLDPVNDPMTLLLVSLAFGIVHIWVGIIVKMVGTIRGGNVVEGIIDHGSWVIFLPGLVLWGLSKAGVIQSGVGLYIMAAGAVLVMISGARNQKSIFMKPISAVGKFYDIVGYFSDVLSYARILALMLASAIIGVVVNTISRLVVDMLGGLGWVVIPVILAFGHLLNLAINALGSFVHSGRLQFVEFFSKFFEGGGTPFRPLRRVKENVSLTD
ncbi:MAG: V-type ATP synthase subunit I [Bacillota bacterium]|jgi:V/A-type H+-transporting ATPase subunit I